MFRVGDLNKSHIVGMQMKALLVKNYTTSEKESLKHYFTDLKLQPYGLLLWPLTIVHVIDESSPLWDISARDLLTKR